MNGYQALREIHALAQEVIVIFDSGGYPERPILAKIREIAGCFPKIEKSAPQAQGWQPINTAPKTGEAILVRCPSCQNTFCTGWDDCDPPLPTVEPQQPTRNSEALTSFVSYCQRHPSERFWQALRNWSRFDYIFGSFGSGHISSRACDINTFNIEGLSGTRTPEDPVKNSEKVDGK